MSCIRFNTPAQRAQLAALAPSMLTPEEVAARHPAPPVTDSKLRRLRLLATDANPKIREAAASSYHAPVELYGELARDPDEGVRAVVARNTATPCEVLRELAHDDSPTVRGWVAVNYFVPTDVMEQLAADESETVRSLVAWKASLAEDANAENADTDAALLNA
ncbi:MAG: hypothetical protein DI534_13525 [Leifsonia xyli]|nr:MAG: hypothetical protein DI534_13525 [Leifsonia xyli]